MNKENTDIVRYTADNGGEIELSAEIVRNLISANPKVTDKDIGLFLKLCEYQKLNPFLKEAYLIKFGDEPATIVVGKEAFTKRAERNPDFNGFEAGVMVYNKNDKGFQMRPGTTYIPQCGDELLGGWCKVYKKNREKPHEVTVMLSEYDSGKAMWKTKPATMIRKVAIVQALREAFPDTLGGLYTEDEIGENQYAAQNPKNYASVPEKNNLDRLNEKLSADMAKIPDKPSKKEPVNVNQDDFMNLPEEQIELPFGNNNNQESGATA